MKLYSLYLTEPQKKEIDLIADKKGLKTSELLRRIIDTYIENYSGDCDKNEKGKVKDKRS